MCSCSSSAPSARRSTCDYFFISQICFEASPSVATFSKRYEDICAEWLGGLTVLKYPSTIEREQLGPHLRQLREVNFLASYKITEAGRATGSSLHSDRAPRFWTTTIAFIAVGTRARCNSNFTTTGRTSSSRSRSPTCSSRSVTAKRTPDPYVSCKEVETAKQLLRHVSFEEMPDFHRLRARRAQKTKFDVQTLGGLKQYLSRYQGATHSADHGRGNPGPSARPRRRPPNDEWITTAFRRAEADRLFASLPVKERIAIEAAARAKAPRYGRGPGSLAQTIFEIERARITVERHPKNIPSLDEWNPRGKWDNPQTARI